MEESSSRIEQLIVAKAMLDSEFRERLIANPKSTISSLVGKEIPDEIEIVILEETPSKFYLVIPCSEVAEVEPQRLYEMRGCSYNSNCDFTARCDSSS